MMFKKKKFRKQFSEAYNKVVIPGINVNLEIKKERFFSKRLIALQMSCLLIVLCVLPLVVIYSNNDDPKKSNVPSKTIEPNKNLTKIPKTKGLVLKTSTISNLLFYDYTDINVDKIKELPVYRYTNKSDSEGCLNEILEYFNIDSEIYDIDVTRMYYTGGHLIECSIEKDSNLQGIIRISSTGLVFLSIEDIETSTINFNYTPPEVLNEESLKSYLTDYITSNSDIYDLNIDSVKVKFLYDNDYDCKVYENTPANDAEILLDYNGIGNYISFVRTGNKILISLLCNELKEHIGDYPIITKTQAEEKYRNNDYICFDPITADYVEKDTFKVSPEEELLDIRLTYIVDINKYIRPIYLLLLRGKDGHYLAAVEAIDDIYILN